MLDPEQQADLLNRAELGRQVEFFWDSRVGTYLRARATEVYNTAIQELKHCDPTDFKAVVKHQNDVAKVEMFEQWLAEAMMDGLQSLGILEGEIDADQE
jgi:hypothetical protein